ncbi:hypothetical protein EVAR_70166_1 [Eumeta japonica]|uniref:Uncharacterized protein n=1 Tax=Eumeta variegata TaxID=151549 RepID=A0A4C2AB56_EUMVA|nr:hypothetical protein EVAR_70166_1 [Eumeta japonica]
MQACNPPHIRSGEYDCLHFLEDMPNCLFMFTENGVKSTSRPEEAGREVSLTLARLGKVPRCRHHSTPEVSCTRLSSEMCGDRK